MWQREEWGGARVLWLASKPRKALLCVVWAVARGGAVPESLCNVV